MLSPVEVRRVHGIIARWLGHPGALPPPEVTLRYPFRKNGFAATTATSHSPVAGGQAQEEVVVRALDALQLEPGRGLR